MSLAHRSACAFAVVIGLGVSCVAFAAEIGRVKSTSGSAWIERAGSRLPARIDMPVRAADVIVTGDDGSLGLTLLDNARLAAGPRSRVSLERYAFDASTHAGSMDVALARGTLAVVSGRMAKTSPDAVTVRTPTLVLGVRGTEFLVSAQ